MSTRPLTRRGTIAPTGGRTVDRDGHSSCCKGPGAGRLSLRAETGLCVSPAALCTAGQGGVVVGTRWDRRGQCSRAGKSVCEASQAVDGASDGPPAQGHGWTRPVCSDVPGDTAGRGDATRRRRRRAGRRGGMQRRGAGDADKEVWDAGMLQDVQVAPGRQDGQGRRRRGGVPEDTAVRLRGLCGRLFPPRAVASACMVPASFALLQRTPPLARPRRTSTGLRDCSWRRATGVRTHSSTVSSQRRDLNTSRAGSSRPRPPFARDALHVMVVTSGRR